MDNDPLAEIYVPELQKTCSLGNMIMHRYFHSQNGFMSCGGGLNTRGDYSYNTCEVYVPGVGWRLEPYNLNTLIFGHTSWTLRNNSVLLLGSYTNDNRTSTELVTPGVGTVPGFTLNNPMR